MNHPLFVYGTLGPGQPNAHQLEEMDGTWEQASVRGTLHPESWGAALGYPGIVLDPEGETVEGHLFISDQLPSHWARLDAFEGDGYERVLTRAKTGTGSMKDAYIYVLKPQKN